MSSVWSCRGSVVRGAGCAQAGGRRPGLTSRATPGPPQSSTGMGAAVVVVGVGQQGRRSLGPRRWSGRPRPGSSPAAGMVRSAVGGDVENRGVCLGPGAGEDDGRWRCTRRGCGPGRAARPGRGARWSASRRRSRAGQASASGLGGAGGGDVAGARHAVRSTSLTASARRSAIGSPGRIRVTAGVGVDAVGVQGGQLLTDADAVDA